MGIRIRTLLAVAAVVFGFGTTAAAQSNGVLRGLVRDQTGMPMPGVVVTLEHPQEEAVRVVLTDLRGEYKVPDLDRGTRYNVLVSHPQFHKTRLQAEADDRITVRLKPKRACHVTRKTESTER